MLTLTKSTDTFDYFSFVVETKINRIAQSKFCVLKNLSDTSLRIFRINPNEGYPYFFSHSLLTKILKDCTDVCPVPLELFISTREYLYDMILVKEDANGNFTLVEARNDIEYRSFDAL